MGVNLWLETSLFYLHWCWVGFLPLKVLGLTYVLSGVEPWRHHLHQLLLSNWRLHLPPHPWLMLGSSTTWFAIDAWGHALQLSPSSWCTSWVCQPFSPSFGLLEVQQHCWQQHCWEGPWQPSSSFSAWCPLAILWWSCPWCHKCTAIAQDSSATNTLGYLETSQILISRTSLLNTCSYHAITCCESQVCSFSSLPSPEWCSIFMCLHEIYM